MGAETWTNGQRLAWTDDRTKELKRLYYSGYSCSQIADRLGGTTRNAVIGKIHRMGWPLRGNEIPKMRKPSERRKPSNPYANERAHTPRSTQSIKVTQKDIDELTSIEARQSNDVARVSFVDLEEHHCRFVVGDPKSPEHGYCGQTKAPGLPYCKHHALRCYEPPKARKAKEAPAPSHRPFKDNRILNLEDA